MKKKLAVLLLLILCIGLVGCGSDGDEDAQTVSAVSDTEQTTDVAETGETASSDDTESDAEDQNTVTDSETDINAETDSAEQADADNSGTDDESQEPSLPEYEVTELDEPVVMYASDSLNVRQGPSTDYEIVGFLKSGRDVTVIGQADTGWYQILYNEEKVFVSDKYLLSEKPVEEPVLQASSEAEPAADNQPQEPEEVKPVTEVKNVAGVIFVGDSRFVQMKSSVGDNPCTWIAESSKGYKWLNENAIARIDNCVGKGSKILINLGVNDPGNIQNYLTLVNAKAEEWTSKGATVYYASVNPVWDNPYVTEEQVKIFNSQLQGGLSSNIHYIDSHSYLESIGYKLVDGLHYSTETNQNLYAYYMSCM
ncbi:MAG: SH3 domain-containing protein [Lachnospiraceae bacterium]|nr:SH3 domain-containing protein [Lachnospiraceae bacterium]